MEKITEKPYMELRKLMLERGYNKSQLSRELGVSMPTIKNKLDGFTEWKRDEMIAICKIFQIDLSEIMRIFFGK